MEEIEKILTGIMHSWWFKLMVGTVLTTLIGWAMVSIRNTSKKIKDSPSKKDLDDGIRSAKKYTDEKIEFHSEKDHALLEERVKDIKEDTTRIERNQIDMNKKLDTLILQLANK